ncbi:hypothetical protein IMY05_C2474000100 [Salix suchowensis]|nr:hypothetical protein IMY05_C2474000100 [Salix suchowensis]
MRRRPGTDVGFCFCLIDGGVVLRAVEDDGGREVAGARVGGVRGAGEARARAEWVCERARRRRDPGGAQRRYAEARSDPRSQVDPSLSNAQVPVPPLRRSGYRAPGQVGVQYRGHPLPPIYRDFARIGASALAPQLHVNTRGQLYHNCPMLTIKLVIIVASGVGKTSLRGQPCRIASISLDPDGTAYSLSLGECAVLFSSDSVSHSHLSSPPLIYCDAISKSCSRRDYTRVTSWRTAAKTMPSTNEKGANLKISRTPKYAARPLAGIKGSGRNGFSPLPGSDVEGVLGRGVAPSGGPIRGPGGRDR